MIENNIDTGDLVIHIPSKEKWIVAFVSGDDICPLGLPLIYAKVYDCATLKKADVYKRQDLLISMAGMRDEDPRKSYAMRRLSEQEEKLSEYTKSLIDKVEKEHEAESVAKKHEVRKYQY